jgi:hypothetical protein
MSQLPDHGVATLLGDIGHAKVLEHEDGILSNHWIPPAMEREPGVGALKCQ